MDKETIKANKQKAKRHNAIEGAISIRAVKYRLLYLVGPLTFSHFSRSFIILCDPFSLEFCQFFHLYGLAGHILLEFLYSSTFPASSAWLIITQLFLIHGTGLVMLVPWQHLLEELLCRKILSSSLSFI